ncbi:MAG: LPS export ABC transporter permease LptG [Desulfobacteraceae bacterium]
MSLVHRYWLKEFIRYFLIVQALVMCIFIAVDYLSRMDNFLEADVSLVYAFGYVLLKTPFMFVQLTPAGVVLAVIVTFGMMNRNNELLALKGSGISLYYLVTPAVAAGLFLAAFTIFLGETLVPLTMARANHIKYSVIKKENRIHTAREDIWIKGEENIVHINFFNPADRTISGVTITFFSPSSTGMAMSGRVDAEKGVFKQGRWELINGLEQNFSGKNESAVVSSFETKTFALGMVPEDLKKVAKKTDQMSIAELAAYVRKVEKEGYDPTTYRVDFHGKIAFPFICLVMSLAGAAIGIRPFVKESMPLGIALGVGVSFFYWVMFSFCISLGYGGVLPPLVAAWAANLFFVLFGVLSLVTADA